MKRVHLLGFTYLRRTLILVVVAQIVPGSPPRARYLSSSIDAILLG